MCVPRSIADLTRELKLGEDIVRIQYRHGDQVEDQVLLPLSGSTYRSLVKENGSYRLDGYCDVDPATRLLHAERVGTLRGDEVAPIFPPQLVTRRFI